MSKTHTVKLNGRILEAATIDFWGTIANDVTLQDRRQARGKLMVSWMESLGHAVNMEEFLAVMKEYQDSWMEDWLKKRITHGAVDLVTNLVEKFELKASDDQIADLADKLDMTALSVPPLPMPGVLESIRELSKHLKLALISDTAISGPRSLNQLLDDWGFADLIPTRVFSEETGIAKPHPKAFYIASEKIGVPQHRIVHIGDLEATDILGAKSFGMAAIRFDGEKSVEECKTCSMADKVVGSWSEIVELLLSDVASENPALKVNL